MDFAIWRACERFNICPWSEWDDLPVDVQADLLAYDQIRMMEDRKERVDDLNQLAKIFAR